MVNLGAVGDVNAPSVSNINTLQLYFPTRVGPSP